MSKFSRIGFGIATPILLIGALPHKLHAVEVNHETGIKINNESESVNLEKNFQNLESNNGVAKSVNTQEVKVTPSSLNFQSVNNITANTDVQKNNISYQAADFQIKMAPTSTGATLTEAQQIANYPPDIDTFCNSYPLNSRCREYIPPAQRPEVQPPQTTEPRSDKPSGGFAITGKVGTLGIGAEVTTAISSNFNARLGVNAFGFGTDATADNVTYRADVNLLSVTALGDYFPFANNSFRLTGGLAYQDNRVDGRSGPVKVNNINNAGTFSGNLKFSNSIAPYLGIGFGNPVRQKGFGFSVDLGILFPGTLNSSLTTTVNEAALNGLSAAERASVLSEIERVRVDQEQKVKDAAGGLNLYPVLSIGVSYGF